MVDFSESLVAPSVRFADSSQRGSSLAPKLLPFWGRGTTRSVVEGACRRFQRAGIGVHVRP
jgi:hypothetical protein